MRAANDQGEEMSPDERFLEELTALKLQDGRDNALIHYVNACQMLDLSQEFEDDATTLSIKNVLKDGWSIQAAELLPLLKKCQPAFAEIRKGVALDYARNLGAEGGFSTPRPNFLKTQNFLKMLCVEGRYQENWGLYPAAMDDYLAALTIGRDYGSRGASVIGMLVSVMCIKNSTAQIGRLAASGHLARPSLTSLIGRLEKIRATCEPTSSSVAVERDSMVNEFRQRATESEKKLYPKYIANVYQIWNHMLDLLSTPYWERDWRTFAKEHDAILAKADALAQRLVPNVYEADTRLQIAAVKLDEAIQAAALALYRLDQGQYPPELGRLCPDYLKAACIDPFSGKAYEYQPSADGKTFELWSLGPDEKNNAAAIDYDPSNGTYSGGDVKLIR